MKKLSTIKKIIETIELDIKNEQSSNALFEEVKKVFKPFIGKPYTKRMETALKNHLGDGYHIYIERVASLINLHIKGPWKDQSEYNKQNGFSMLIGYSTTETYQEGDGTREGQGINYFSLCYGNATLERIEANKKFLKSKKVEKLAEGIDLYHEAKKILSDETLGSYRFPARYGIERAFNLRDERGNWV